VPDKILEFLLREGLLTEVESERVLLEQRKSDKPVSGIITSMGLVEESEISNCIARQLKIPYVSLDHFVIERKTLELMSEEMARRHRIVPLYQLGRTLAVAMVDPFNINAIDEIQQKSQVEVLVTVATESAIKRAIDQYYRVTDSVRDVIKSLDAARGGPATAAEAKEARVEDVSEDAPVVRLVNLMITQAIRDRASDIHIEPRKQGLKIRYRIDGVLHDTIQVPSHLQSAVITRVKILAGMNIAERRLPQDGHIAVHKEGKQFDLRIATFPIVYGEKIVMRILDRSGIRLGLAELGFEPEMLTLFENVVNQPYGMILATGPTGCGKTTTLYAALDTINSVEKNIVTIEDPVEYDIEMINQSQINPKAGLTFATGLRALFRLDPDIIMVGEIRDFESAQIAIQAALTGHLVFSSLHTNDAPSTATRLIDMGVEPYLVTSTLLCALSQRLVRLLCPNCKQKYEPSPFEKESLGLPLDEDVTFYNARGCKHCNQTGFKGRNGIFEILIPDDDVRSLVVAKSPTNLIREQAIKSGMTSLRQAGLRKVLAGTTTVAEVLRVTSDQAV
jgi:type IV pilus assembly protein PilB